MLYSMLTSSGQVDGSMPTGTSLNVLSPRMGGLVSRNMSLKLCVALGAMHDTFHFTMFIFEKRWRTVLTIAALRPPPPGCMMLKKPPISGLARFCMKSSEFCLNSSSAVTGK